MANIAQPLASLAIPITDLNYDPANARKHNEKNLDAIKASLHKFGQRKPIVVQREGMIVRAGNGTLAAAKALGWKQIAAVILDDDNSTASQFAIADNRTAELAEWDNDVLSTLLDGLPEDDRELLGFDAKDMQSIMAGLEPEITEDEVPEPPAKPITKLGDLWLLGEHRLLCGDSTKAEDVERLMAGAKADCMFTDPPYAIYGSSTGVSASVADDKMVRPFFRDILALAKQHTQPFAHLYICCDFRSWASWWEIAKDLGLQVKNCIVWDKKTPGMGFMYQNQHEFVMFAVNHYQQTAHMSKRDGGQRLVAGKSNVWSISRAPVQDREHNATKPVELVVLGLQNSSDVGDLVVEPFSGSGTTFIAAEQLGRKCYGMEISPQYCDVIVKRWETLTGKKATLASS